jgi:hypothetical protein
MKRSYLVIGLILSLAIATLFSHTAPPFSLAQTGGRTQPSRVLPVAVGDNATVRLTRGGSRSGQLTALTPTTLTLSIAGRPQTLGIAEVRRLELRGQIAIANPGGRVNLTPIRGTGRTVSDVPITALTWSGPNHLANLNLQGVSSLSQAEFNTMIADSSLVYGLSWIEFESANRTMDVRVKPFRKP